MKNYDSMHSVYGKKLKTFFEYIPKPNGKAVRITAFHDSGLAMCKVTGRSSTGVLIFINKTPVYWYDKMQKPVETATYGPEFSSAHTFTDLIVDTQWLLKSMGVPLDGPT